jgi:hypothetical protein
MYFGESLIATRLLYTTLFGDLFFHTALVVNYDDQRYVFHSIPDGADINDRVSYPGVKIIGQKNNWNFIIEPLDTFLAVENGYNSIIKIASSGILIDYKEEIMNTLLHTDIKVYNCSYIIGKYLELEGVMKNKSILPDVLYYFPRCFSDSFGNDKYFKL